MVDAIGIIKDPDRLKELFGASPTTIGKLQVDVLVQEIPDFTWEIPTHRVDIGVEVSDSRYQRPVGVTLECVLLDPEYSITNALNTVVNDRGWDNDDWRTKRDKLMEAIGKNEFITIITPSGFDYSNMMIESIQPDISPQTTGGFFFRISARHVETVSSEVTGIDVSLLPDELKRAKNAQAQAKKAAAKNQGKKAVTDATAKKQSILVKLKNALTGG